MAALIHVCPPLIHVRPPYKLLIVPTTRHQSLSTLVSQKPAWHQTRLECLRRFYPTRRSKGQVSEFETPVNSLILANTPSNSYRLVVSNSTTKSQTPQVRCSADTSGMRCKDFCTELAVLPRTSIIITARTSSSVSSVFKSMVKRLIVRLSIKRVRRL